MLNIKEKAVISSAKQKLSRLKTRDSTSDPLSLKKKQRGLLIKLQHEYNEIKFMKNFQKRLLDERKKVLQQQARHFKTISGISSVEKHSKANSLNFKSSITVLKERNKKLPIKCYDIALNFKKKSDLFEKRIILRSHRKTLNELLSLYFDLQLNAAALYTINQKNTHSQIIATLKEISQKTSNKMNNIIDYTSQKKIECIMSENNDLNKNAISLTSHFSDPNIFPVAGTFELSDVMKLTASSGSFPEQSEAVGPLKPQQNDLDTKTVLKSPSENFCDDEFSNNVDNLREEPHEKLFYNYDCKRKHCLFIFDKEYVFSNRILNFQRDNKRKYVVEKFGGFSSINLINASKFSTMFVSESGFIENIFSNVNFERSIMNRDVVSFLRTFHLYVKKFLRQTNSRNYFIEGNENSLALRSFFQENSICVGENNARIQIRKFSLEDISKVINAMAHIFSDDFRFENTSENIKFNHFFVKIKENTNLETLDLDCFVYQNVPDNIKFNNRQDVQIWEIHDVSSVDAWMKNKLSIANGTASVSDQFKNFKSHQTCDSQNIVQRDFIKPIVVNSANTKCKQLDLPFKDDCYQKISDIQPGRKISFGKQFNKNNQETFIEKELISQVFEQNSSSTPSSF